MKRSGLLGVVLVGLLLLVSNLQADEFDEFDEVQDSVRDLQPVKSIVGVTLGTPAFLHLNCATFNENKFGARLAVGGFPGTAGPMYGFQASAVKKIGEGKKTIHELSLGIGYSMINTPNISETNKQWRYLHFSYGLTLDRFMLEVGLSAGTGSYPNPQLLAQLGIAFSKTRFRQKGLYD